MCCIRATAHPGVDLQRASGFTAFASDCHAGHQGTGQTQRLVFTVLQNNRIASSLLSLMVVVGCESVDALPVGIALMFSTDADCAAKPPAKKRVAVASSKPTSPTPKPNAKPQPARGPIKSPHVKSDTQSSGKAAGPSMATANPGGGERDPLGVETHPEGEQPEPKTSPVVKGSAAQRRRERRRRQQQKMEEEAV